MRHGRTKAKGMQGEPHSARSDLDFRGIGGHVGGFSWGRLGREMKACYCEGAQLMDQKDETRRSDRNDSRVDQCGLIGGRR